MIDVSRETSTQIDLYVELVLEEAKNQNLIGSSTAADFMRRHIDDSLQLIPYAPKGPWLDIGSGAGLPGIVVALADSDRPMVLSEPRRKRAEFLSGLIERFAIATRVSVEQRKVEAMRRAPFAVISARAVASLTDLFGMASHLADLSTVWILPKGRTATQELETARTFWHGDFKLVESRTDPSASIVVATRIQPKRGSVTR